MSDDQAADGGAGTGDVTELQQTPEADVDSTDASPGLRDPGPLVLPAYGRYVLAPDRPTPMPAEVSNLLASIEDLPAKAERAVVRFDEMEKSPSQSFMTSEDMEFFQRILGAEEMTVSGLLELPTSPDSSRA